MGTTGLSLPCAANGKSSEPYVWNIPVTDADSRLPFSRF